MKTLSRDTIQKLIKLTYASSKDETRYHLCGVSIDNGKAVATDGHIIAWLNEPELLEGITAFISSTSIKMFKKSMMVEIDNETIKDGEITAKLGTVRKHVFTFNDSENPTIDRLKKNADVDKRLSLNPELLHRIYKAVGSPRSAFSLVEGKTKISPIDVLINGDVRVGMIMPMKVN